MLPPGLPASRGMRIQGGRPNGRLGTAGHGGLLTSNGLWQEGAVRVATGSGFFRGESRPARDLGVLLAASMAATGTLRVLDAMAGCGIRAARWLLEAGADAVWANDADPDRLPLLRSNLQPLLNQRPGVEPPVLRITALTAQKLLARCLLREERFSLVDLDAFGSPMALVPLALEAVAFEGVLYLASTDGRSPTGHDRSAAIRRLGAAARSHPASWELALRLQLGVIARAAWTAGRGLTPLFSFSEGRTFRTAVRVHRRPSAGEEEQLGLVSYCHRCGDQQVQSLRRLRPWAACDGGCGEGGWPLSISGPLWIGALQHPQTLAAMATIQQQRRLASPATERLLQALVADSGWTPRCWPTDSIGHWLGGGPPPLRPLVAALEQAGHHACVSAVMAAQVRSDAPWPLLLAVARGVS